MNISYEGRLLMPVTAVEAATVPWNKGGTLYDSIHGPQRGARTGKTIVQLMKPGDALYYWDGPWGALTGSSGLALVRNGQVLDTWTIVVS